MKNSKKEALLDMIEELAENNGLSAEEYVMQLMQNDEEKASKELEGMPESFAKQLGSAKEARRRSREDTRKKESDERIRNEISVFRKHFPDVAPEDIPDEVWNAVAEGAPLAASYALCLYTGKKDAEYASSVNDSAETRAASPAGEGQADTAFTKEMVENMSQREVGKNYKGILASIKKWKL